jgi:predicted MFS family arabinose efflux permease
MSNKREKKRKWFITMIFVVVFIVLLLAGGNFLLPLGALGVLLWMILTVLGLFLLISWHAKSSSCQCLECGNTFSVSFFKDFLSLQNPGTEGNKYLICPECLRKSRQNSKRE